MPKFIIERNIPKVGHTNEENLKIACKKSNDTIKKLSQDVNWQHSYLTNDKLYCVYIAEDESAVKEHAALSGFPADRISIVNKIIDPSTAE